MRILFCSQAAYTGGGVETWLESLSSALAARGWDVVTGLAKGRFHDPERYAARHRVMAPVPIESSTGFREDRILELERHFARVRPDVILPVSLYDALLAAAHWKATTSANVRLATCIHGQRDDRIEQVRAVAAFVDLASSVSKRIADRLLPIVGDAARVHHIPTGVPLPTRDTPPRTQLRRIAYIGRFDSEKRVRDLVPLIRALPECHFDLTGSGPDEPYVREAVAGPNVVFHGEVSRAQLYESIYPNIDAIVILSAAEAGPIVAWEAMLHGVVPVVSDYVGRREENGIRHGETGLVFPIGDVGEAARLVRAHGAPGSLRELSLRARDLPAMYTEDAFGASWDSALRAAIEMPPRRGNASDLPPLVSPGFLARLRLGLKTTSRLRRLLGRRFVHEDSGSEWPH